MKLPFSFGTRLVFRLLLPGLVLSMALFPVIRYLHAHFVKDVPLNVLLPFVVTFLGWLTSLLDLPIYQAFEGRRFWPHWLRECLIRRQSDRLERLQEKMKQNIGNVQRTTELEILMADFPLRSDGMREARYPTSLGNLITEYEEYPTRKYEADGVFYWSRVWWKLPKEVRDSLDDMQAMVDGALYIAALLYLIAPLCLAYAVIDRFVEPTLIKDATGVDLLLLGVLSAFGGYVIYILSLPAHRQFGEQIKAMFDCFLVEVDLSLVIGVIARKTEEYRVLAEPPAAAYRIAWRYLRWHRFRPYGETHNVNIESYRSRFPGHS